MKELVEDCLRCDVDVSKSPNHVPSLALATTAVRDTHRDKSLFKGHTEQATSTGSIELTSILNVCQSAAKCDTRYVDGSILFYYVAVSSVQ